MPSKKRSLLLYSLILLLTTIPQISQAQSLSFTHVNVVDTVTGKTASDMTVVLRGNRIADILPSSKLSHPPGRVVDASGKYLIPGLWDMHTHVFYGRTAPLGKGFLLPLFVVNGVTGIRDMGSDLDSILQARSEAASHQLIAPRMYVSGPMLDGPKRNYTGSIAIHNATEAKQAVDRLVQHGVDFIKIQSGIPRDAYFAAAGEATHLGISFVGHVPDAIRASEAIDAGQHSFEHLIGLFEASSTDEESYLEGSYANGSKKPGMFLATYDATREAAIIQQIAEHHVWQCPTLFWERGQWLADTYDYLPDPDLAYAPASWKEKVWPGMKKSLLSSLDTDPAPVRERFVAHELDIVRKLHAAKVPFLAGTDAPAGIDLIPGSSLHAELQRFVAAGFTPLEALQTATLNPARFLNRLNDFGTVETGKIADLLLLDANPVLDIANTKKIAGVVLDGRYLGPDELSVMRERLKKQASLN